MVGFGGLSTQQVLNRLVEEYKKAHRNEELEQQIVAEPKPEEHKPVRKDKQSSSNGVIVMGESGMLVRLAHCCNPLPGDKIVGYARADVV
jgi:Guanosine polyphosphate pyrophosphohydrolases/synthetases